MVWVTASGGAALIFQNLLEKSSSSYPFFLSFWKNFAEAIRVVLGELFRVKAGHILPHGTRHANNHRGHISTKYKPILVIKNGVLTPYI